MAAGRKKCGRHLGLVILMLRRSRRHRMPKHCAAYSCSNRRTIANRARAGGYFSGGDSLASITIILTCHWLCLCFTKQGCTTLPNSPLLSYRFSSSFFINLYFTRNIPIAISFPRESWPKMQHENINFTFKKQKFTF